MACAGVANGMQEAMINPSLRQRQGQATAGNRCDRDRRLSTASPVSATACLPRHSSPLHIAHAMTRIE